MIKMRDKVNEIANILRSDPDPIACDTVIDKLIGLNLITEDRGGTLSRVKTVRHNRLAQVLSRAKLSPEDRRNIRMFISGATS